MKLRKRIQQERERDWGDMESLGCCSREELEANLSKMVIVDGPRHGERVLPDGCRQYFAFFRRIDGPRFQEGYFPPGFDFGPCLQMGCKEHAVMAWFCEDHSR